MFDELEGNFLFDNKKRVNESGFEIVCVE